MSEACPLCRAPRVVTSPSGRAASASAPRSSARVRTTRPATELEVSVERDPAAHFDHLRSVERGLAQDLVENGPVHAGAFGGPREGSRGNVGPISFRGRLDDGVKLGVVTGVLGGEVGAHTEEVGDDLDLAGAAGTGP